MGNFLAGMFVAYLSFLLGAYIYREATRHQRPEQPASEPRRATKTPEGNACHCEAILGPHVHNYRAKGAPEIIPLNPATVGAPRPVQGFMNRSRVRRAPTRRTGGAQ